MPSIEAKYMGKNDFSNKSKIKYSNKKTPKPTNQNNNNKKSKENSSILYMCVYI